MGTKVGNNRESFSRLPYCFYFRLFLCPLQDGGAFYVHSQQMCFGQDVPCQLRFYTLRAHT